MRMINSKKGFVWIPMLVIIGVILIFVILGNFGSFKIGSYTYYLISPQFQSEFRFWEFVIFWVIIQIGIVYGYKKLFEIARMYYGSIKDRFTKIIDHFKEIFK